MLEIATPNEGESNLLTYHLDFSLCLIGIISHLKEMQLEGGLDDKSNHVDSFFYNIVVAH